MLKKGLIRRVGDGSTAEVWHDHWMEDSTSMTPMGALKPNSIQLVADLINPETNQWDVETIWSLFFSPGC